MGIYPVDPTRGGAAAAAAAALLQRMESLPFEVAEPDPAKRSRGDVVAYAAHGPAAVRRCRLNTHIMLTPGLKGALGFNRLKVSRLSKL